ncbi:hypothetical protein [Streptomyces brasiliscabiei]|nr:hypothetical protein [Streptomyces brasiliscabiei]
MSLPVSRLIGAVLVLAGISGALWAALGVPQDWTGGCGGCGPCWR